MSYQKKNSFTSSNWKEKAYERHRLKVKEATCVIDVNPPQDRPHVIYNAKGLQLEREKQDRIMKENFILLRKLHDIMHRKRAKEESHRLKWDESRCIRKNIKNHSPMEAEGREYEEAEGERGKHLTPKSSSIFEDTTRLLTMEEAGECLHTLGKCDSGLGYAYLGLNASNKGLTGIKIILMFKHVLFVDVSGNRLTTEEFRVLSTMKYLLMIRADRNLVSFVDFDPMPYLQVLTLNNNKLQSASGISHQLLECLELNYNNIEEVTLNPYDLTNLKTLELRGNMLTTTNGIFFPGLTSLFLAENQIERLEGLEILRNLKILHLRSNKLVNLDGFDSRCEKLSYVNLRNNELIRVSELEKLSCLPALETLIVMENPAIGVPEAEEEVVYRNIILAMLPNLIRIDKETVDYHERRNARELRKQMSREGTTFADLDLNPPND